MTENVGLSQTCVCNSPALSEETTDARSQAGILASSWSTSWASLQSLPSPSLWLRMDNKTVHVTVGLRLGTPFCQPHKFEHKITTKAACLSTSSTGLLIGSSIKARVCSTLDLATGYWKMSVSTELMEKTTLLHTLGFMSLQTCHWLCSALTTLQGLLETF